MDGHTPLHSINVCGSGEVALGIYESGEVAEPSMMLLTLGLLLESRTNEGNVRKPIVLSMFSYEM